MEQKTSRTDNIEGKRKKRRGESDQCQMTTIKCETIKCETIKCETIK